jgi:hypothetical protein
MEDDGLVKTLRVIGIGLSLVLIVGGFIGHCQLKKAYDKLFDELINPSYQNVTIPEGNYNK